MIWAKDERMTHMFRVIALGALISAPLALSLAQPLAAQQAQVAFGNLGQDTSLPVTVDADKLSVDDAAGTALFEGNVVVVQGDMTLKAPVVDVSYDQESNVITLVHATGGVTITSIGDAAQSAEAVYTIDSGLVVMTGDVLLTQGPNVLSGQKFNLNLTNGTGVMEGRVSTTFVPGKK